MASNVNCTLIIPNVVRPDIVTNVSDLSIYGISIYNDIREVTESDFNKSKNFIIVGRVSLSSISDLKLFKSTFDLNLYFISTDKLLCSIMSDFCTVYNLDYTKIDYSLIVSVLYEDRALMEKYLLTDINPKVETLDIAKNLLSETDKNVVTLASDYLVLRESYNDKLETEKLLKQEISKINSDLLGLYTTNESLINEITSLISQYVDHYQLLKDYKVFFSEDVYDTVSLSSYKERPKIIYFKEYTDFLHFESFIETLTSIIGLQLTSSFKVVRLHDSCDVHRIKVLENKYFTVNDRFLVSDIISNDFILSYGNYVKLFDVILNSPLDYLVVIDCKKFDNVVLLGDYLKLNLCRNVKDLEVLGLDPYMTIVNNNVNNIMSWDTYERYNEFIEDSDRFIYLSSRPVMKKLYELICDIV